MLTSSDLHWLPSPGDWLPCLAAVERDPDAGWSALARLAGANLDFVRTERLDRALRTRFPIFPEDASGQPERLAVLGSATMGHLVPAIRAGGLRRGLWIDVYEGDYGQSLQALLDPTSALHRFAPTAILFASDAQTVGRLEPDAALGMMDRQWRLARQAFGCAILQQTVLPVAAPLLGSNEHRWEQAPGHRIAAVNHALRAAADAEGVDLLAVDTLAARHGVAHWHNPALWHRAKQEISPLVAPLYGDHVARLLAARRGLSRKVLVLDLDNTLWGGEVGESGPEGLTLGAGSAEGEGFAAVQAYAAQLGRRGVVLAVASKNDPDVAAAAFERHPEMVLKMADIACFRANWDDKPGNLRAISEALRLPLDSFVFVDDSPFERDLVRRTLPMVAVPEVPEEPALVPYCLADAGYFEAVALTVEDRRRGELYRGEKLREEARAGTTDLAGYLAGLEMRLNWRPFDRLGLPRIHQLINKTNQFNLTTRRMSVEEVTALIDDDDAFGLQFRLSDRLGDSGMIAVVIGRRAGEDGDIAIDTWLMSCRVLGRQVEEAVLGVMMGEARRRGGRRLIGIYRPTAKNGMVADLYPRLGFAPLGDAEGSLSFVLSLADAAVPRHCITVEEGLDG